MATDPIYGFELLDENDGAAAEKFNVSQRLHSCGALHFIIKSEGDTTPPGSPAESDGYILGTTPTGAWAGQGGKFAFYVSGGWEFFSPREGMTAYVQDVDQMRLYTGSVWQGADAVNDLNQNISATFVEAEVQAISDKVDELLAALRESGWIKGT